MDFLGVLSSLVLSLFKINIYLENLKFFESSDTRLVLNVLKKHFVITCKRTPSDKYFMRPNFTFHFIPLDISSAVVGTPIN